MAEDKKLSDIREYISDLKTIKSEVGQILDVNNEKDLFGAAKHYPGKLNLILTKRNLKSVSGVFPFLDLAFMDQRKQDIDLLDLNSTKDSMDHLWDVIHRIDQELNSL